MKDNSGKILLALLAGASAGVIAGLLMAPDTGEATRDTLRKSASKMGKDLESRLQPLIDKLSDLNAGAIISSITGNEPGGSSSGGGNARTGMGTTGSSTGTSGTGVGTAGTGGTTASRVGGTTTSGGSATSGGGAGVGGVS